VNSGVGAPVISFPSVESIATAGWLAPIAIKKGAVHVWGFSLDGSPPCTEQCRSWLSEEERGRAGRYIHQQDQVRFILAHGGLRAVLSRYTGVDPSTLMFQLSQSGKPGLPKGHAGQVPLKFNLSHSHGRMLIAIVGEGDIGVDLEQIHDTAEVAKLAKRFYAPAEYERVMGLCGSERTQQFYRYWVAKEAFLKGQGVGLRSLQQCEILYSDDSPKAGVMLSKGATLQPGWTIHWLDCGTEWAGAVSVYGSEWMICNMTSE
jgi:4'-phosphopantetheinyl transferase